MNANSVLVNVSRGQRRFVLRPLTIFALIGVVGIFFCGGILLFVGIGPLDIGPASRDLPAASQAYRNAGWPWVAGQVDPRPAPSWKEDAAPEIEAAANSYNDTSFSKAQDALFKAYNEDRYEDMAAPLVPFQKTMEMAIAASKKSRVNFHRDFDLGPYVLFPEYAKEKAFAKMLTYAAEAKCASGDVETAIKYLKAAHRIGLLAGEEPNLISMLVEIATQAIDDRGYQICAGILRTNPIGLAELEKSYVVVPNIDFAFHIREEAYSGLAILRNVDQYGGAFGLLKALSGSGGNSGPGSTPTHLDPSKLHRDGMAPDIISRAFLDKSLRYWASIRASGENATETSMEMDRASKELEKKHSLSNALSAVITPHLLSSRLGYRSYAGQPRSYCRIPGGNGNARQDWSVSKID
ncbi:MAG TPA: hypothetical protein VGL56_12155 [Fimbriimonadaceae bacterium]